MENKEIKYYVPKLEDFHVGYRYECFETIRNKLEPDLPIWSDEYFDEIHSNDKYWTQGWCKKVCSIEDICHLSNISFTKKYTPLRIENIIRTKCLDKEDILSLGWKQELNRYFINTNYLEILDDNRILITQNETVSFCGKCPSINELVKIMKLLEIYAK